MSRSGSRTEAGDVAAPIIYRTGMPGLDSRRNAVLMTVGWWLLRRKLRSRAESALAGYLAGSSGSSRPRKRHRLRNVVVAAALAAAGVLVWRRLQGGDDWGDWQPAAPVPPPFTPEGAEPRTTVPA